MTTPAKELMKQALALPPGERIELAEVLLSSVDGFASPEIEAAWREEIERRVKDFEEGRTKSVPAEEVHRKALAVVQEVARSSSGR
jgi:putative addiction module component (TIGR02574 family)